MLELPCAVSVTNLPFVEAASSQLFVGREVGRGTYYVTTWFTGAPADSLGLAFRVFKVLDFGVFN
jgi:hypothetical protein